MKKRTRIAVACVLVAVVLVTIAVLLGLTFSTKSTLNAFAPGNAKEPAKNIVLQSSTNVDVTGIEKGSSHSTHPDGENAADIYKNAWVLYKALSDEEKEILAHPRVKVDADKADALFKKIQPIMDLLRHAKNDATYCDWAMGKLSFNTPIPQMNLALNLGSLAAWDANYLFPSDPSAAVSDLAVQAQLGHSVGDESMFGLLIELTFNTNAFGLIRQNASMLTPDAISQAGEMLNTLLLEQDFAQAMTNEAGMPRALHEALLNPQTRKATLDSMFSGTENNGDLRTQIETQIQSIDAQGEWLAQTEQDFVQKAHLPDAEFNAWWSQVKADANSRAFAANALPVLNSVRNSLRSAEVNQAMLAAGLRILQGGTDQLSSQPDPTTGQSFTYVPTPTGFELRSTFQNKGKPVTMSFPTPAK